MIKKMFFDILPTQSAAASSVEDIDELEDLRRQSIMRR
jgi:hypothetical protein